MTQIGEGVAIFQVVIDEDDKCQYKPEDQDWLANLNGSGEALAQHLGTKPYAASEADLSATAWPSQAHHLIPHLTLKSHPLAQWLKSSDMLFADTYYNVDHENNGKWMPYASGLPEWVRGATNRTDRERNRALMFKVMSLARIQLHQGRHSSSNRYGVGEAPYKERVKQYLKKIKNNAVSHYAGKNACNDCKSKKFNDKFPPRDNLVRYVDKASELVEKDINQCRIFVSRIAAEFAETGGFDES